MADELIAGDPVYITKSSGGILVRSFWDLNGALVQLRNAIGDANNSFSALIWRTDGVALRDLIRRLEEINNRKYW